MSEIKALQEVIDALEADGIPSSAVLKSDYVEYCRHESMGNFEEANKYYYKINGFLWGLEACGYITESRRDKVIQEVIYYGK